MQTLAPLKSRKIPKKSKEFRCESQRARELEEANKGAAPSEEIRGKSRRIENSIWRAVVAQCHKSRVERPQSDKSRQITGRMPERRRRKASSSPRYYQGEGQERPSRIFCQIRCLSAAASPQ